MSALTHRRRCLLAMALLLLLTGCGKLEQARDKLKGDTTRPCFDHEECFANEYCANGKCAPYTGTTRTEPDEPYDLGRYLYDLGDAADAGDLADQR